MKTRSIYRGRKLSQISFPLGGLGSGCVGLAGNGRLIDWEIFNRPNKGGTNGLTHFAIKAERDGKVVEARVLHGDEPPPYWGTNRNMYFGAGFGLSRDTVAGLPHFRSTEFHGAFPLAEVRYREPKFPGQVSLRALNPFIPLNDKDSSLPAAFFEISVTNPTAHDLDYTIGFSVRNPHQAAALNKHRRRQGMRAIHLSQEKLPPEDVGHGDLTLATDAPEVSFQEYWFRGTWFDTLGVYWRDFTSPGKLKNRFYPVEEGRGHDHATLAAHVHVPAGETATVRFVLAWSFPHVTNYWSPEPRAEGCDCPPATWRNYYATLFRDSTATAAYALKHWERLERDTRLFADTLLSSTLPAPILEAVSANLSILKTPTVKRLQDGSFYGFEGCGCEAGCCEGTCMHVWNYAYALPFLFPRLERSIRELEYRHSLRDDGALAFRMPLPVGRQPGQFPYCADGQFGAIIKTYREWKVCGDTAWLRKLWPRVKKSLEFAWAKTNDFRWDPDRTGVLDGRQHHTLDMELFGPNSWLTGFYLAALKAGAEMADACGDPKAARRYRDIFARGQEWVEAHLFNGEYYCQQVDLEDKSVLAPYAQADPNVEHTYWNAEHGEIKYQIGEGCGIDQVLAQWHANLCGLGDIFDRARTRSALRSIHRYNFKRDMRQFANPCRLYCVNDEAGTVMVDWPEGRRKPVVPVPYSEETMHGFEYQAACHLIMAGMVREGVEMARAVRDRYDGERRNPWNEIECGSNYARSMASYAFLNAFSGFEFDMTRGHVAFAPVRPGKLFRCFWSLDSGWGQFMLSRDEVRLEVLAGSLTLSSLGIPVPKGRTVTQVMLGEEALTALVEGGELRLDKPIRVTPGKSLVVRTKKP
jgi:uncharacterized protein (DUF608 family)